MMLVELIMFALVAAFVAICVLGHVLLAAAIVQCVREDLPGGRQQRHAERKAIADNAPMAGARRALVLS